MCDEENKTGSTVCEYGIKNPDAGAWKQKCIMDESKSVGEATITCDWNEANTEIRWKHQKNKCEMKCFDDKRDEQCAKLEEKLADWDEFEEKVDRFKAKDCSKKVKESHSFFSFLPFLN